MVAVVLAVGLAVVLAVEIAVGLAVGLAVVLAVGLAVVLAVEERFFKKLKNDLTSPKTLYNLYFLGDRDDC